MPGGSLSLLAQSISGARDSYRPGVVGYIQVVTTPLSLARELWRYGEPDLAWRAFRLSPEDVLLIGRRAGEFILSGTDAIWPTGPKSASILVAAVEHLEGKPRPCARRRRLPEAQLPEELQATEEQRWEAVHEVDRVRDAQRTRTRRRGMFPGRGLSS